MWRLPAAAGSTSSEASASETSSSEAAATAAESSASEATSERTTVACSTTYSGFAKLVVTLALVRIRKNTIGFCSLLELLLSLFVARITVRVILYGLLLIGFLDLVSRRGLLNT